MMAGDWWGMDLAEVDRKMKDNFFDYFPSASTINGKLGDLFNCSGNINCCKRGLPRCLRFKKKINCCSTVLHTSIYVQN
jgi:hypothetical protein